MATPEHLGGHCNVTHVDSGALACLVDLLGVRSVLDIGCGPGGMMGVCEEFHLSWTGIDGDASVATEKTIVHDFTLGAVKLPRDYSLAWSVEFLEHVEERFLPNVFSAFLRCDAAFVTHALPGKYGHHHVNCQPQEYWVEKFREYGFAFQPKHTQYVRQHSTMRREFARNTGMLFIKVKEHEIDNLNGDVR